MEVRSDRWFRFAVEPPALWAALTDADRYQQWWPWLRRFDGECFSQGARWRCTVRSPLLYRVRFDVVVDEVVPGRSAVATISGDIAGQARLDITAHESGSRLRLASTLASQSLLLRTVARLTPPLARFGHDRLIDRGVCQFRAGAFGDHDPADGGDGRDEPPTNRRRRWV